MKNYVIIGGSKGVGEQIVKELSDKGNFCHVISRSEPSYSFTGNWYQLNALTEELPSIEAIDGLVYCLGSINLKPFNRLSLEDFNADLNVNFFGALKAFQQYLPTLKNRNKLVWLCLVRLRCNLECHITQVSPQQKEQLKV